MEDMEQIAALLHIHEKAHHHGSALTNIRDEAFRQLKALDDKIVKDRAERQAPQVTVVNEPEPPAESEAPDETIEEEAPQTDGRRV